MEAFVTTWPRQFIQLANGQAQTFGIDRLSAGVFSPKILANKSEYFFREFHIWTVGNFISSRYGHRTLPIKVKYISRLTMSESLPWPKKRG